MKIIGRKTEIDALRAYYSSNKPEFIALYGRRRVGKTYLIEQTFANKLAFSVSGVIEGKRKEQETVFLNALRRIGYGGKPFKNWFEAFEILKSMLSSRSHAKKRCVIFIDELPCFDTLRAGFIRAFGDFWNSWCNNNPKVMLIVCGSATTWMIRNIIDSHGGLHNRITHEMHIHPFTLGESEKYLKSQGIRWDRMSIVQMYSVIGGVPYYMSLIQPGESAASSIDRLFYSEDAVLKNEYRRLFNSLFKTPEPYVKILEMLCKVKSGMTRGELAARLGTKDNGHLGDYLENLQKCDFIRRYHVKDYRHKRIKESGGIYQVMDFFTVFHNSFMNVRTTDPHYWSNHVGSPTLNTWLGLSFERICMYHINQLKESLGISKIGTEFFSWRSSTDNSKVQIDLIIERADRVAHICEMKYSTGTYSLQKNEALKIQDRLETYRSETGTKYTLFKTLVTTYGLKKNACSWSIDSVVTMNDLFA